MISRVFNIALCLTLSAGIAAGVQERITKLVTVKVKVLDAAGRSINDLHQDDFLLQVDGVSRKVETWTKSQDFTHHSTYTLVFKTEVVKPVKPHLIEVQVTRPGAKVQMPDPALSARQ